MQRWRLHNLLAFSFNVATSLAQIHKSVKSQLAVMKQNNVFRKLQKKWKAALK